MENIRKAFDEVMRTCSDDERKIIRENFERFVFWEVNYTNPIKSEAQNESGKTPQ